MLKDEWIEYFELVNGRKPSPKDFKEGLDRGEFVLAKQGDEFNHSSENKGVVSEAGEETATAKAMAQAKREQIQAQEAMTNAAQEKRRALSQKAIASAQTLQSGRQPEVLQREEEQRQELAKAKARLASHAPTRPDSGERGAIPVFSNQASQSEEIATTASQTEKKAQKQVAKDKRKAEKVAAKIKAREIKATAKLEKRLARQLRLMEAIQKVGQKADKKKRWQRASFVSSVIAVILMVVLGGAYGFWRNASGKIEGTWELQTSQVMNKETGKLSNALATYQEKNEVYKAYLEVDKQNELRVYSYFYPKSHKEQPTFTASDYLESYQTVDQWNKAITYTKEVSDFQKELTSVVKQLYPNAEQSLVDYYITDNVDNYKLYRKGKRTKTYSVEDGNLVVSTYNEDGKLTSRDTYTKANQARAKVLHKDYQDAKKAYEKNHKANSTK